MSADEFDQLVNMTPKQLKEWLDTDESKDAGTGEGRRSGQRIVEILEKSKADLTESDEEHKARVVGYVKRHLAQRPDHPQDELQDMTWTHSLKNWGHDPLK